MKQSSKTEVLGFDDWFKLHQKEVFKNGQDCFDGGYKLGAKIAYKAVSASRQEEVDKLQSEIEELKWMLKNSNGQADEFCKKYIELQKRIDVCEKLRDSQFDKLWNLTKAIEDARVDADEDFDLFLNYLSNILKGE